MVIVGYSIATKTDAELCGSDPQYWHLDNRSRAIEPPLFPVRYCTVPTVMVLVGNWY